MAKSTACRLAGVFASAPIASDWWLLLFRKQLHCEFGKNYPSLAQKHFNAAASNSRDSLSLLCPCRFCMFVAFVWFLGGRHTGKVSDGHHAGRGDAETGR